MTGVPRLDLVRWIGRSPCAGKTTIAEKLARRYGMRHYRCDDALDLHLPSVTAATQPTMHRLLQLTCDERWSRPIANQVTDEWAFYEEEFPFILRDLGGNQVGSTIAEGTALLPHLIAPLLNHPREAIWLVPTAAFQHTQYPLRPWISSILEQCSNPSESFDNWITRDVAFADAVEACATHLGLRVIRIDGTRTLAEITAAVDAWLFA